MIYQIETGLRQITKSQVDLDDLLQLHTLDKIEEDKDISWECCLVVDY
jgi:hypothetical protein